MASQVLRELEAAAQVLLAPPNLITVEQRQAAEAVFLQFHKTKLPYQLCREILETTTVDYVLFETVNAIKAGLIREWVLLQKSDITSLRQYLLHYVISKPTLAPFVREKILQVIAIMVKRGSIEDHGEERKQLLNKVKDMILNEDLSKQLLGCSIIAALIQEYTINVKSSDLGLAWEVHAKARKEFESVVLRQIFEFCIRGLGELISGEIQESILPLIKQLIAICESVLTWGFISSNIHARLFGLLIEPDNHPPLHLSCIWSEVMLDPQVIQIFFNMYWKTRTNLQLAHHSRNCLVQLSSLRGEIVHSANAKREYLTNYVQNLFKLLSNIVIIDQEAYGFAKIFEKLIFTFDGTIAELSEQDKQAFFDHMTRLTCLFAEGSAQEESMPLSDCMYIEAFELLLHSWLVTDSSSQWSFSNEVIQQSSVQIFNTYLQCHLSPPDGRRGTGTQELNNEEIDAEEEDDRSKFKDQLQCIGVLGRRVLNHTVPLLSRLLEDRTTRLKEHLNRLVSQSESLNITEHTAMENLYEDLHYLVLIAGSVLCMDSEGEVALPPSMIIRYSKEQEKQGQTDLNATLRLVTSPQSNLTDIEGAEQSADHVIRLIAAVFRLSEVAKIAINYNAAQHLSPELCSTIIWFLHQLSLNYLTVNEFCLATFSPPLLEVFGEAAGSEWTFNFIIDKIACNVKAFQGEPALIAETMELLLVLARSKRATCLTKTEGFGNLVNLATKSHELPQAAKRGLMRAIMLVGRHFEEQTEYVFQVLEPLQTRFKSAVFSPEFARNYHQEEVRLQILDVLEASVGVIQGVTSSTAAPIVQYIFSILNELPRLFTLYHNYQQIVQMILDMFCECSEISLFFTDVDDFYEICLRFLQSFRNCNRIRLTTDTTAEEDAFQDILSIMTLIENMLNKSMISLNEPTEGGTSPKYKPIDVALFGFTITMPLIATDLVKYPVPCQKYYKMIMIFCEVHPEMVFTLPPDMLQQLLISIEMGLTSFGDEVTTMCCDMIQAIAKHIYLDVERMQPPNQLMAPFMNLIMNLILMHQINLDLMPTLSIPLFQLICCYEEQYKQIVQRIIAEQTDPITAQRLAEAFNKLFQNITFNSTRFSRLKFRDHFEKFIKTVQGFLIIK